jgi:hypothetical protein
MIVIALIFIEVRLYGTGFPGKTLWDWFNLFGVLAIPAAVGLGTIWFTRQQAKVSDAEVKDNQREAALQDYIEKMSELLLHENLRKSAEDAEVRTIARVRTLTVLPRLDADRKGSVVQFLKESSLINWVPGDDSYRDTGIVDLDKANLRGANLSEAFLLVANLSGTDLRGADLSKAILDGADLSETTLVGADLRGANLRETKLSGADLRGAGLTETNVTADQLVQVRSQDIIMEDANPASHKKGYLLVRDSR